ncbi:thioredoxin-like protein [Phellopilus nigrolimitatus]|nr:thioredoxin-like protein [Phellopilus nigrolimitatus]
MATISPPKKVKIDVTSDSICPFCFIGKRKLERAIDIAKERGLNLDFDVEFHPFLLDPTLDTDVPVSKRMRYEGKYGAERFAAMEKAMVARGRENGINLQVRQTTESHRLIALAYEKGGMKMQSELIEKLFNGYFEREQDIGDINFLAKEAVEVGLFPGTIEAEAWIVSDEKKTEVQRGIREAQMMGISGVPFFVLNNKYAISGAEDSELFVEVFERFCGQPCAQGGRLPSNLVCE